MARGLTLEWQQLMGKIFIAGLTFSSISLSITDPNITGASSIAHTLEYVYRPKFPLLMLVIKLCIVVF
jgi:hypothetical protein